MKTIVALCLYFAGKQFAVSEFIDEDTITAGYGKLSGIGVFKYPLPRWVIKKHYHTTSWDTYMHDYFMGDTH
jgi:hypothetical protein